MQQTPDDLLRAGTCVVTRRRWRSLTTRCPGKATRSSPRAEPCQACPRDTAWMHCCVSWGQCCARWVSLAPCWPVVWARSGLACRRDVVGSPLIR